MELIGQVLDVQPISIQLQQKVNGEFKNVVPKTIASQVETNTNQQFVSQTEKNKWNGKAEANHTHQNATTNASGLMSSTDKTKLDGVAVGANNYAHPTNSGNKHIPSGGSAGQILRWTSDGTAVWGNENNTAYGVATTTANGLMSSSDKSKLDGIAAGANNYSHPNDSNTRHVTDAEKSSWNSKAAGNHNHDSNYFKKHLGEVSDFNNCLTEGQYAYGTGALNTPSKGYGTLIVYVNGGGTHDNSSNWIWQLAYSTGTNENYIRQKVNNGAWTPWVRMTLNAYDSIWNDGYVRTRIDGVTAVGKYLDFHAASGGSYSRLETPNGHYLQFKGYKVCLMNVGTAAPTTSTCPVGYIYGQY